MLLIQIDTLHVTIIGFVFLQFSIILPQNNREIFSNILESMIVRRYFCIGTNRYTKFSLTLKSLGKRKIQSVSYKKKLLNQCIAIFLCKLFLFFTFVRITLNFFCIQKLNIVLSALVILWIVNRVSKQNLIGDKKYTHSNFE